MGRVLRWLFGVLIFLAVGSVGVWGYTNYISLGPLKSTVSVVIPGGASINNIAKLLARIQIISQPIVFIIAARTVASDKALRAGEFNFPAAVTPREVLDILQNGETVVRRLTVAEGLSTSEILERLSKTEGLSGAITSRPAEGEILPETYHFSFGDSRDDIILRMRQAMKDALLELWPRRAADLPINTIEEALILASIVEKETGRADERARVAGVFINRLHKIMKLQSDPTVIYGLTRGIAPLGRPLSGKDLAQENPYNTYVVRALPPGPISNPGRAAIEAVLNPAATGELYFVADGKGGHVFSRTLAEHNRNVSRWRKLMRQRKSGDQ